MLGYALREPLNSRLEGRLWQQKMQVGHYWLESKLKSLFLRLGRECQG